MVCLVRINPYNVGTTQVNTGIIKYEKIFINHNVLSETELETENLDSTMDSTIDKKLQITSVEENV